MEEPHRPEVVRGSYHPGQWWVQCNCGYYAGPFRRESDAQDEADDHVLSMAATE